MRFFVMTLFPEMIDAFKSVSIIKRGVEAGYISIEAINIRDFANNKHGSVDDYTYGGGNGMLIQAEPVYRCYRHIVDTYGDMKVIYLSPQGRTYTQPLVKELVQEESLILLCGHYEGIDQRVIDKIDPIEVSVGDYVLTGGEIPAMIVMDSIARLVPGVLHNDGSAETESFENGLLEYPQYTRPAVWEGMEVPGVLLSGDHAKVDAWRLEQSRIITKQKRPDLLGE